MAGPIPHRHATGIHRGAFVQSDPPDSTDLQDGVLWVQTTTEPPYPLFTWNQTAGTWDAIGTAAIGALRGAPSGSTLIKVQNHWLALPPGTPTQQLQLAPSAGQVVPQWADSCCADVGRSVPTIAPAIAPAGDMFVPTRCGAAETMAAYLEHYYSNVRDLLNGVASRALAIGIAALATLLLGAAPGVLELGGLLSMSQVTRLAVLLVSNGLHVSICPPLDGPMRSVLLRAFYCALSPMAGTLLIDDQVRATWCATISGSSVFTQLSAPVLVLLSNVVSLSAWQSLANLGAQQPSSACAELACGLGRGLRGSAVNGALLRRAIQGGAAYGVLQRRSISGGARYGARIGRAVQGGATS